MGEMTRVGDNAIVRRLEDAKKRGEAQGHLAEAIEMVLIQGDLSKLTPEERVTYYNRVCESLGLNPLTKPFAYIPLNGKLQLYALKDATEQLRKIHGVSIERLETERHSDLYVVKAYAKDRTGRTDASTGAVPLGSLKGEALANAIMKCETKAKRRATLSICGLGMLDEIEVDSIEPQREPLVVSAPAAPPMTTGQVVARGEPMPITTALIRKSDLGVGPEGPMPPGLADYIKATMGVPDDAAAPCAQPLYAMTVAPRQYGKTMVAEVTLSDGRVVHAKGTQRVEYLEQACQNQTPLDVMTETKTATKGPNAGQALEVIVDVKTFKQTLREELEASVAAGPEAADLPAQDDIPF